MKFNTGAKIGVNVILYIITFYWIAIQFNINIYNLLTPKSPIFLLVMMALLTLLVIKNNKNNIKKTDMGIIIILGIIILLNVLFNNSNIGSIINIFVFVIMLVITEYIKISDKTIRTLALIILLFNLIWIHIGKAGYNLNTVASSSVIMLAISCILLYKGRKVHHTIFICIITIYILYKNTIIIISSNSRGALLALIGFLVIRYCISSKILTNRWIYSILIYCLSFGSLVFVGVYTWLWKNNINNMMIGGKSLFTGREMIWYEIFEKFKKLPFSGIGSNITLESYTSLNVHNAIYMLLVIYGIWVFSIVMYLLLRNIFKNRIIIRHDKIAKGAFAAICAILINSFFETALINKEIYPSILMLFAILNSRRNIYSIKEKSSVYEKN